MPHRPGSGRIPQRLGGHGAPLERHRAPEHRTRGLGRPDGGWRGDPASVRYARRALDTPQSRSVGGGIAQRAAGDRPRPAAGAGRRPVGPAAAAARAARGHQSAAARCRTGLRPAHALSGGGAGNRRGGNRAAPAARQRHRLRPRQPAHAPGPAAPAGRGAQGCGCRIGQHRSAVLQATGQPHVRCPRRPGRLRHAAAAAAGRPDTARGDAVARGRGGGPAECRIRPGRHAQHAAGERGRVRDPRRHRRALSGFAGGAARGTGLRGPAVAQRGRTAHRFRLRGLPGSRCSSPAW